MEHITTRETGVACDGLIWITTELITSTWTIGKAAPELISAISEVRQEVPAKSRE